MTLPRDAKERKEVPVTTGVLDYFPDAIAEIARVSKAGNDQHNPGQPLHWAREKSTDHADCLVRHLMERGTLDTDGHRHSAKVAWRALALLQLELEAEQNLGGTHEEVDVEDVSDRSDVTFQRPEYNFSPKELGVVGGPTRGRGCGLGIHRGGPCAGCY